MSRRRSTGRRVAAATVVGAVVAPGLLFAASPALADQAPVEPAPLDELPWCQTDAEEESLAVSLTGVPERQAAPTDWTEFTYEVVNTGAEPLVPVFLRAATWYEAADGGEDGFGYEMEWQYNGEWRELQWESDAADGHFGMVDELAPGDSAEVPIRTRALEDRTGWVTATAYARGYDPETTSVCHFSNGVEAQWALVPEDAEAPGEPDPEEPGQPSEEPQPGEPSEEPNAPAPQGGSDDDAELAETGGSNALPVAAGIGGAALVAGAGALLIARRSRTAA
ncbi:hypothetical protein FH609_001675 [Streptomyces sp. 3MP-14]|uniref:LPXTG cell wall anchor domain-containing protein n=1 Tax=Streptomyces mimosae TaxID=2586635 RepID=A0A5N6AT91_9ACTN|nr:MULTISPECIES: LAETG motif-containing sortase-dependent surface protein [Streptomyces]KAB8170918.1 hypothetical protein FH607_000795 [Streptomyces mimosae]KAB8179731.1 hypothetical protein FH609_001675 [Streptomyces sp. 3MP-14]